MAISDIRFSRQVYNVARHIQTIFGQALAWPNGATKMYSSENLEFAILRAHIFGDRR